MMLTSAQTVTTPRFLVFWGCELPKIVNRHLDTKRHILGWQRVIQAIHG